MVQISNTVIVAFLLVAPSLAIPVSKGQDFQIREADITARDVEYLDDLAARDPSFGSFFRKVKNFFKPSRIDKAVNTVKEAEKLASMLKRDDSLDFFQRGFDQDDVEEFTARDLEELEELAARDPKFGSFFRKIKHFANFSNLKKVASVAGLALREDDGEELTARDFEDLEELATRDPSFGSFFRKVKHFVNFNNIKKAASVATLVVREVDEVFERDLSDLELDMLD